MVFSLFFSAKFFILPSSSTNLIFYWKEESSSFVECLSIGVWCFTHKWIWMMHFWQQNHIVQALRVASRGLCPMSLQMSPATCLPSLLPYCFSLHHSLLHLCIVLLYLEHFPLFALSLPHTLHHSSFWSNLQGFSFWENILDEVTWPSPLLFPYSTYVFCNCVFVLCSVSSLRSFYRPI